MGWGEEAHRCFDKIASGLASRGRYALKEELSHLYQRVSIILNTWNGEMIAARAIV